MCQNKNKKIGAFTIVEMITVFAVMAVIMVSTYVTTMKSISLDEKKIKMVSESFYNIISNAYSRMLITDKISMESITSEGLRNHILNNYIDGNPMNCDFSKLTSISTYTDDPSCAKLSMGLRIAIVIDNECKTEVSVSEYPASVERINSPVQNTCGYIAYKTKKSTETLGVDLFSIALGKRNLK